MGLKHARYCAHCIHILWHKSMLLVVTYHHKSRAATQDLVQKRDFRDQKLSKKGPLGTEKWPKKEPKWTLKLPSAKQMTIELSYKTASRDLQWSPHIQVSSRASKNLLDQAGPIPSPCLSPSLSIGVRGYHPQEIFENQDAFACILIQKYAAQNRKTVARIVSFFYFESKTVRRDFRDHFCQKRDF